MRTVSKSTLTDLGSAEAFITEMESDKQSDPHSDSLAEKRRLPCLWTRSSSLWVDNRPKVPCKDRHTHEHAC